MFGGRSVENEFPMNKSSNDGWDGVMCTCPFDIGILKLQNGTVPVPTAHWMDGRTQTIPKFIGQRRIHSAFDHQSLSF